MLMVGVGLLALTTYLQAEIDMPVCYPCKAPTIETKIETASGPTIPPGPWDEPGDPGDLWIA